MIVDYSSIYGLEGVYLEDSYVLSILETPGRFVFVLDAVLTPEHSQYRPPRPGEQYCYEQAHLDFEEVTAICWLRMVFSESRDATGSVDLGNIDTLTSNGNRYTITGDWGEVEVLSSKRPRFHLQGPRAVTAEFGPTISWS
ncbi:MAG: hypothetical protein ABIY38_04315 [Rhodococcus sp. (in: high G+C Gram-positive bacteria)]